MNLLWCNTPLGCHRYYLNVPAKLIKALRKQKTEHQVWIKHCLNLEKESESERKTAMARNAANVRHSKPGGSREKQEQMRKIWATGKYTSRDLCAEQECANLGVSFSVARKALRNTPKPLSSC